MSNFDINVDRRKDGQTDEQTDERKSGLLCRKVRRSGRCFMQGLMVVNLEIGKYTNFDINVELRHKC